MSRAPGKEMSLEEHNEAGKVSTHSDL